MPGESVETVTVFLGHSSLAVTTTCLRQLEGVGGQGRGPVAGAVGLQYPGTIAGS